MDQAEETQATFGNSNEDTPSTSSFAADGHQPQRSSQHSNRSSTPSIGRSISRRFSKDVDRDASPAPRRREKAPRLRSQSLRASISRVGQSVTWSQLARRSYIHGNGRKSSISSNDEYPNPDHTLPEESARKPLTGHIVNRFQSLKLSTRTAWKHPRTILLPTLTTFAILTTAGLGAIIYASNRYRESQSAQLVEEARELAYQFDDLLSKAQLPLYTLKEMAGQFTEFTTLRSKIAERGTYYTNDGRAFRNVTEFCTADDTMDLYWKAAESIVRDSRMGDVLLNIQLQPAGVVCLNYPPVTLNPFMDHTDAIGLDRIHDIYQSNSARESIETNKIGSTGPLILVQDKSHFEEGEEPHESLILWTTIYDYDDKFDLILDDNTELNDFWGFAGVLLDWHNVVEQIGLHEFFEARNSKFALVEVLEDGSEKVIEASDSPPLTQEAAQYSLSLKTEDWFLILDLPPPTVPKFAIWGSVLVIFASFLLSLALMQILVSRKNHEELLCRCIPRSIVRRIHAGETIIEKFHMATICYIDIVSFTTMSGHMKANEVMEMLSTLFQEFDRLAEKHNCFNCETIGDAYVTVCGGPEGESCSAGGAANIAAFALDAVDVVQRLQFGSNHSKKKIKIRAGVASGEVIAGVIGTLNVPKFTIFGETTWKAQEMESTSLPMKVQCTEETMRLIRGNFKTDASFQCKKRQEGTQNTWWIVRPSEFNDSCISDLDDITISLSSANNTIASTQSEQHLAGAAINRKEAKTSVLASVANYPSFQRRDSSVLCEGADEAQKSDGNIGFESMMSNNDIMIRAKKDSCFQNIRTSMYISLRSLSHMFFVAGTNKPILLSSFTTFTILCLAGVAIVFVFAKNYEQERILYATDIANKADRWLDKELDKALLPLFAVSELVKVTGKWDELPYKIEVTEMYNLDSSVYNNITGICDAPIYIDPFIEMATDIKNSSGMQGLLVNVQLAPSGVLCLTHPKNNTEDFPPGLYLDTSGAIGLNLFETPSRSSSSKAAVTKGQKTIQGPLELVQGNLSLIEEALIARYPIFMEGYNMTVDGVNYPFYGLTIVLMDWSKLKEKFNIYNFFDREYMQFRMTRYDSWNDKILVIANSSYHEILNDENSISIELKVSDDAWTLMVGYVDGFEALWLGWCTACVVLGSFLVSLMVLMVLTTTKMNEMLLHRMMPRKAIESIEQGKTFVERDSEATIFFSHLIGFEKISGEMGAKDFLLMLTLLYEEFDKLAIHHECTKIETIGAYYIVKGPGPELCSDIEREGVARIALFALDAVELVKNYRYKGVKLQIRAGFATGPIVAGVIGSGGLPKYTVFGDTVNFSSRMESTSAPMMIQCSHLSYSLLCNSPEFAFQLVERESEPGGGRGVFVKGKGQTVTYWLKGCVPRCPGNNRSNSLILGPDSKD